MLQNNTTIEVEKNIGCIAEAMSIIGNKWTALILRDLFKNDQRFCQLEKSIPEINPRILSQRLDFLESNKIIISKVNQTCSTRKVYHLTKKGWDLLPILQSMADWGQEYSTS